MTWQALFSPFRIFYSLRCAFLSSTLPPFRFVPFCFAQFPLKVGGGVAERWLLSQGNSKLGEGIHGWTIPAVDTCPGKTPCCSKVCFGTHGRFVTGTMRRLNVWRYEQSKKASFVDRMCDEIRRRGVLVLRVHVVGDFATPRYTSKWIEIAARCSATRMFAYSRSWRVEKIRPLLYAFGALPNVRLWLSADKDSGMPTAVPPGIRVAWLQVDEQAPNGGDLVFQVRKLRRLALPLAVPICDQETPSGKERGTNCSSCRVCWE
jgi:hypothetical protein